MYLSISKVLTVGDCEDIRDIYGGVLTRFASFRRPGAWLIDTFPELEYFPLYDWISGWKRTGDEIHKKDAAIFSKFWYRMKKEIEEGRAPYSWGKLFVQSDYEKHGIDELCAIYTAYPPRDYRSNRSGGMIEAGSETTAQVLNNTIVGLLQNPEAIKKGQEELDRVIGDDRTPTIDDEKDLPYIHAIGKETLRWRPVNKLGQNHYVIQDDWYEGMFIPKNTIVMLNLWALHYDPEEFPEPEKVSSPLRRADVVQT